MRGRTTVLIVVLFVVLAPKSLGLPAGARRVGRVGNDVGNLVFGIVLTLKSRVRQPLLVAVSGAKTHQISIDLSGSRQAATGAAGEGGTHRPDHWFLALRRFSSVSSMKPALRAHFGVRFLLALLRMF